MHSDLMAVRQNIGFLVEKKLQAHQLCEQFFKTLTAQKQSKFIKDFKEMRAQALEGLVKALSSINKNGRFNYFNLRFMHLPLNTTLETSFLAACLVEGYLKEVEKETLWRDLSGKSS